MRRNMLSQRPVAFRRILYSLTGLATSLLGLGALAHDAGYHLHQIDGWERRVGPASEANRWAEDAWPMVWHVAGDAWPRDVITPEDAAPIFARALAAWSEIPTADIPWRMEGWKGGIAGAAHDGYNTFVFDPNEDHGGTRVWQEKRGGRWLYVESDIKITRGDLDQIRRIHEGEPLQAWLESLAFHGLGHALGLGHASTFPVRRERDAPTLPVSSWPLDPVMSYGRYGGGIRIDDAVGASLLRPRPEWLRQTGQIAGQIRTADGPVPFVHVWALQEGVDGLMDGVGAFTNENGDFLIEGLQAGDYVLWAHPDLYWLAHPWFYLERQGELLDVVLPVPVPVRAGQATAGVQIEMRVARPATGS